MLHEPLVLLILVPCSSPGATTAEMKSCAALSFKNSQIRSFCSNSTKISILQNTEPYNVTSLKHGISVGGGIILPSMRRFIYSLNRLLSVSLASSKTFFIDKSWVDSPMATRSL